jgi:hypothetical protein
MNKFRIVIFSKNPIIDVRISIDSIYLGNAIQSIDNKNLYVLPWNTSIYNDGLLHDLLVEITDNQNNKINNENQFSLGITTRTAWTHSKFILYMHWPAFVNFIFCEY